MIRWIDRLHTAGFQGTLILGPDYKDIMNETFFINREAERALERILPRLDAYLTAHFVTHGTNWDTFNQRLNNHLTTFSDFTINYTPITLISFITWRT